MTLSELIEELRPAPADSPLVFVTEQGPIAPGYHVTELRRADIKGIDCGGNTDEWREVILQLLDGVGRGHMPVGTFRGIVRKSLKEIDGLGVAPLRVEFAHGNAGLGMFAINRVTMTDGRATVSLTPEGAVCKPALRRAATLTSPCCGAGAPSMACCG